MSGNSGLGLDSISVGSSLSLSGLSCGFNSRSLRLTSQRTVSSVNRSHVVHNVSDSSESRGDSSHVAFVLFTGCHSNYGGANVGLGDNWLGTRDNWLGTRDNWLGTRNRKCSDVSGQHSINGGDDGGQGVQFGSDVTRTRVAHGFDESDCVLSGDFLGLVDDGVSLRRGGVPVVRWQTCGGHKRRGISGNASSGGGSKCKARGSQQERLHWVRKRKRKLKSAARMGKVGSKSERTEILAGGDC